MTYTKPKNMKYTDMCIFIDANIYNENKSEETVELIFQYIYHLCFMLSNKNKYFRDFADYDDFSLYAAEKIYMRLVDPRQFQEEGKKLAKIKNVLDYIKSVLYGIKVDYQNKTFRQVIDPNINPKINCHTLATNLKNNIEEQYKYKVKDGVCEIISEIPSIIAEIVYDTPYKKDPVMLKNIYLSCLISFLKSITLSNSNIEKLNKKESKAVDSYELLLKLYKQEQESCITLWKLDPSMTDYIRLLYNKIKSKIAKKITATKYSLSLSDDILKDIMNSAYENTYNDKDD